MTTTIHELELEVTAGSCELMLFKHECIEFPNSFKTERNLFRKSTEEKVSRILVSFHHVRFRAWTTDESKIPKLTDSLHQEFKKSVSQFKTVLHAMQERDAKIDATGLIPVERPLAYRT